MRDLTSKTPPERTWNPANISASRDRGLLPWLDWRFSLIFPLAILLLAVTLIFRIVNQTDYLEIKVTDETNGEVLEGAIVSIGNETYTADEDGLVRVERPEDDTTIRVTMDGYETVSGPFGDENSSDQPVKLLPETTTSVMPIDFDSTVARGRVLDSSGLALQGVIVRSGSDLAVTRGDGTYVLSGIDDGVTLSFASTGFQTHQDIANLDAFTDIRLEEVRIKAIYADQDLLAAPGGIEQEIKIANETEINAIVIDIKQGTIYYDSKVRFFLDSGSVSPVYDAAELLKKLKDNDIYAIARLVVFQDPIVAEAHPDLAVRDTVTGDLWRNDLGIAWVNAFHQELWDANIALAEEATDLGFDEIQYDYVRFPSDGDLSTADFGQDYTAEARQTAITGFVKQSSEAIHAKGGKLSADLFGYVTIVDDEQYIGQHFSELEPYLDFVCMMIYPSHFQEGNIASAPGHPNDYPYETILESLQRAEQNVPGSSAKFRPWLQDFTYYGMREYTVDDVRKQIDAAEDFGTEGWMLWGDPLHISVDALKPQE